MLRNISLSEFSHLEQIKTFVLLLKWSRDWEYRVVLIFSKSGCLEISIHQMFTGLIHFPSQGRIQLLVTRSGMNLSWWAIWRKKAHHPCKYAEIGHCAWEVADRAPSCKQCFLWETFQLTWWKQNATRVDSRLPVGCSSPGPQGGLKDHLERSFKGKEPPRSLRLYDKHYQEGWWVCK